MKKYMTSSIKSTIESLLFVSPKPLTVKELCKFLEKPAEEVQPALNELMQEKAQSGVVLLDNNGEYQLATNPANSPYVKNFLNAELREKLTDATVEVLSIIAYRQPISKAEIEAIRGVNSQYSLRHLSMRGLIEKVSNPADARSFLYQTTTEFLQHLGLTSIRELPEFEKLVEQIKLPETPALINANTDQAVKSEEQTKSPKPEPEKTPEPETILPEEQQPETESEEKPDTEDEFDDEDDEEDSEDDEDEEK
jgi:segregation and condensation protein B